MRRNGLTLIFVGNRVTKGKNPAGKTLCFPRSIERYEIVIGILTESDEIEKFEWTKTSKIDITPYYFLQDISDNKR